MTDISALIAKIEDVECRLNLKRCDIAELPEGANIVCNISTLRSISNILSQLKSAVEKQAEEIEALKRLAAKDFIGVEESEKIIADILDADEQCNADLNEVAWAIAKADCRDEQDHIIASAKFALGADRYGKLAKAAIAAMRQPVEEKNAPPIYGGLQIFTLPKGAKMENVKYYISRGGSDPFVCTNMPTGEPPTGKDDV